MNVWKHIKKSISVVLVFALLVQIFPLSAFAVKAEPPETATQTEEIVKDTDESPAIAGEVEELRGESEKHFLMEDGTYRAVTYEFPVHYLDEEENWQDIDNTLQAVASFDGNGSSQYVSVNGDVYKAFAADLESGQLFTTGTGDYAVSLSLQNDLDEETTPAPSDTEILPPEPTESESTEELPVIDPTDPSETVTEPETLPTEATEPETTVESSDTEPVEPSEATTESETPPTEATELETAVGLPDAEPVEPSEAATESETLPTEATESEPETVEPESTEPETEPTAPTEALLPEEVVKPAEETAQFSFNQDVQAVVVNPGDMSTFSAVEEAEQAYMPANIQADVVYAEVYKDVDFTYASYSNHIKESIVLYSADAESSYNFVLNLTGLTPVMNEDGSISLANEGGEEIYLIPAPYMFDDAGEMSDAVSYTLTELDDGTYLLTVEADPEWIKADNRAFPVTIDPTLIDKVTWTAQGIGVTYVTEGDPNTNHCQHQAVYLGYSSMSIAKECQVFIGWDALPSVPANCEVVSATIHMAQEEYSNAGAPSLCTELHAVTDTRPSDWSTNYNWITRLNWNSRPNVSSTVLDYTTLNASTTHTYVSWDLTGLVKSWYEDSSIPRAACIKIANRPQYSSTHAGSVYFTGYGKNNGPVFIVAYRNMNGLEPYYTYQSMGAGNAGSVHISDYTGNLTTVTPLASFASTVNPFTLNLVYNSSYFSKNYVDNYTVAEKLGLGMYLGSGMGLNVMQRIEKVELQNDLESSNTQTYLKYTDGDGTVHFFAKDADKDKEINDGKSYYYDEDGLGLKIYQSATNYYQLSDDKGNISYFANTHLVYIDDNNGNRIRIDYTHSNGTTETTGYPNLTGDRIRQIVQINKGGQQIPIATFQYTTDNYLASVTDYVGNVYSFTYACYKLTKIHRNNKLLVRFLLPYNNTTNRFDNPVIGVVDAEARYAIHMEYDGQRRVKSCYESYGTIDSSDKYTLTSSGAGFHMTYATGNQTVCRDFGNDRVPNNSDDILTTYSFDYAGRTACASSTDTIGRTLGASNAVYTSTGSTDKTNNRTLRSASIGVAAMGLVKNGGFENIGPEKWTLTGTGADNTNAAFSTDDHRTGKYALKTWITKNTAGTVGAQKQVSLHTDINYTLSAYVKTSDKATFKGKGIYLKVTDNTGTNRVWQSDAVNYVTDKNIDDGWTRISLPFYTHTTQPTGSYTLSICCDGVGDANYIDDVQLEKATAPSNVNLLENGNFQMWNYGWTENNASFVSGQSSDTTGSSAYAMRVNGDPSTNSCATQTVQLNESGKTYVLSGWAKANAVPDNITKGDKEKDKQAEAKDTDKQFGLRAILTYADGTKEYHYVPFNPQLTNWQFTSMAIVPQKSAVVSTVQVVCAYEKNANTAYFDNISLVKEVAQTMKYDDEGNLVSVQSTGNSEETASYSKGNLIKQVTGGYGTLTYTYDDNHNIKTASNNTVKESVTYDTSGNATSFTLQDKKSTYRKISTSSTYTADKNRVASATDAVGATTSYTYNKAINVMANLPSTITDPSKTTRSFTYDPDNGRALKQYISGVVSTSNTYDAKGNLQSLSRSGYNGADHITQNYNFAYDGFGNTASIKVGNKTLSSYTYANKNGLLTKQTYGNGQYTSFTYDNLGRKKETKTSSGDTYQYKYTGDGQLYSMTDVAGGFAYQYTYDTLGRLMQANRTATGTANHAKTMQAGYTYDTDNRIKKVAYNIPGVDNTFASYYYSSDKNSTDVAVGALTKMSMFSKGWINYTYDAQGRLFQRNIGDTLNETYAYLSHPNDPANRTTTWINGKSILAPDNTSLKYFTYNYNFMGYITTEQEPNSKLKLHYTYDNQGQLLTAAKSVNGTLQKTYTYTYDTYGNIRTASDGTTKHTYTYGDSDWADLLTAYDGTALTYDAIGNPTSYYNGNSYTMTWRNGRELQNLTKGGKKTSYEYDVDGLRNLKTNADGSYSVYYWLGNLLLAEERHTGNSTRVLVFSYDENNSPVGFQFKTNDGPWYYYLYAKNIQGDVVALYRRDINADGTRSATHIANYEYDPWGKLLSIKNAAGQDVSTYPDNSANVNPLRYRGYYYDNESGFYYLQSRYYDPSIGRFINADTYVSTGQGFVGYNMFAYCGNNPVLFSDPKGIFFKWLYLIPNWGAIHRAVEQHILEKYKSTHDLQNEVPVTRTSQAAGRMDIFERGTGEVWEIKHKGLEVAASLQATSYVGGTLKNGKTVTALGAGGAFRGDFDYSYLGHNYHVEYNTPAPGVIIYDFDLVDDPKPEMSPSLVDELQEQQCVIMGCAGLAAALGGAGALAGGLPTCYTGGSSGILYPVIK